MWMWRQPLRGKGRGWKGGFCTALMNEHGVSPSQTCCPRTVRSWCALVRQPQETPQGPGSIRLPVTEHDYPPIARKHPQSTSRKVWPAPAVLREGRKEFNDPVQHNMSFLILGMIWAKCFRSHGTGPQGTPQLADQRKCKT